MGQAISSVQFFLFVGSLTALASALGLALFLAGVTQHKAYREHHLLPSTLPWIGRHSNELFASVRANIRGVTQSASLFSEAYNRYSLKGVISVVPTWTKGPQVLVPPSMIPWLGKQPSAELNAKDCTFENMQFKYTVQHPEITHNDLLDLMIKRDLTKSVGHLNDVVVEEIHESMKDLFQSNVDSDGWTRISVWDAMIKTVARSANRVFVGPELCKNEEYLMSCVRWTRDIQVSGAILHMFPKFLKPVVAWFATIPNRRDTKINLDHAVPLVRQRLDDMTAALKNPESGYEAPDELLSWMIKESFKRTQESEKTPEALAYRLLLLNFAAVSTSTIGATNAVLDLLADPNFSIVIPALREEAQTVLDAHNGIWTKTAVQSLRKLDSALRESARVSGVGGTGLARRVRLSQGVTLPDGTWVPQGATVGVAQAGVHFDPAIYGPTAEDFDAFRFSRPREEAEKSGGPIPENEDLVTTSPAFLAFSHGVHACPGRFFAANQLKLILANFLLEYDVQPLPFRPANTPLGDVMIPPLKAAMTVRKRVVKA